MAAILFIPVKNKQKSNQCATQVSPVRNVVAGRVIYAKPKLNSGINDHEPLRFHWNEEVEIDEAIWEEISERRKAPEYRPGRTHSGGVYFKIPANKAAPAVAKLEVA